MSTTTRTEAAARIAASWGHRLHKPVSALTPEELTQLRALRVADLAKPKSELEHYRARLAATPGDLYAASQVRKLEPRVQHLAALVSDYDILLEA